MEPTDRLAPVSAEIKVLGPGDETTLRGVAPDVFDHHVVPELAAEFLADPRHHLAVAVASGRVVGFASAVHYIHPDKPPELWVNEVGVVANYRKRGIGRRLLEALFTVGRDLGCREAWVLTDRENEPAKRLYASAGGREPTGKPVMFEFSLGSDRVQEPLVTGSSGPA